MRFKNCLGIIWSVSTLTRSRGATRPSCRMNGSTGSLSLSTRRDRAALHGHLDADLPDVHEMTVHGRSRRHLGADQVGAAAPSLASLEVAVGGGGAALTGHEDVGVHAEAHAATRFPPLETRLQENIREAFLLCLPLHPLRAGDDHGL